MTARATTHAIERFQERVANLDAEEVRGRILSHAEAIEAAAKFGAPVVLLGDGARLVHDGATVVTVLAKGMHRTQTRGIFHHSV